MYATKNKPYQWHLFSKQGDSRFRIQFSNFKTFHFCLVFTVLSWTMCLLAISCVSFSMFFFAFATVTELEVTGSRNVIFRILVPFQGRLLIIVSASCCERVFLTCRLTDITIHFFVFFFQPREFFHPSWQETLLFFRGL